VLQIYIVLASLLSLRIVALSKRYTGIIVIYKYMN